MTIMTGVAIDTYELLPNTASTGNGRMRVHMFDSEGHPFNAITMTNAVSTVIDIANEVDGHNRSEDTRYKVTFTRAGRIRRIEREPGTAPLTETERQIFEYIRESAGNGIALARSAYE